VSAAVSVRPAKGADLGRLLELYRLLEGPYSRVEPLEGEDAERCFARILADPNQRPLVAEAGGEVVGSVVLVLVPSLTHGGSSYAVIENVVTDGAHRGRGIGRALMEETRRLARRAGAYKLMLCSNVEREAAHRFYRAVGLRETHTGYEVVA